MDGAAGRGCIGAVVGELPRRVLVQTRATDEPGELTIEVVLTSDGDQTRLVVEARGKPLEQLGAYGATDQIHGEELAAYLAGRAPRPGDPLRRDAPRLPGSGSRRLVAKRRSQ